ncbi:hypothetical protein [Streptomyces sp. NRRL B-24085]|uniref:hypothetical protein n=1 Tax=Streptomyces sp. NRRL B-24085 TaxID=1709476 RepID=UPI0018FE0E93
MTSLPVPHVGFLDLGTSDLVIDALYAGGSKGNSGDDPISKLIPGVGNQGGFRYAGSPLKGTVRLAVLYTSGAEVDWPDHLDTQTGTFTYYGDNRTPGRSLHDTPRSGNMLLRDAFAASHGPSSARAERVPPFLLFQRAAASGRSVRFRGLLAPGGPTMNTDDELAAIWRSTGGERFQNYRARFTVLDQDYISRSWLQHVLSGGNPLEGERPGSWRTWSMGVCTNPCSRRQRRSSAPRLNNCQATPQDKPCWRRSVSTSVAVSTTSRLAPLLSGG